MSAVEDQLRAAIDAAPGSSRLILLIGPRSSNKSRVLRSVAGLLGLQVRIVGFELSEKLLPLSERDRRLRLRSLIEEVAGDSRTVLIDNIEVLFEPSLKANPLASLEELARDRTVVAVWPAELDRPPAGAIVINTQEAP